MVSKLFCAAFVATVVVIPTVSKAETFTVCAGEYERNCGASHDVYVYCYETDKWAKETCTKLNSTGEYTSIRLKTHDGNKCGYAIDRIVCK